MFKQILVAIAGAVAAQLTAASLTLTSSDSVREPYEAPPAAIRLAIVPGSTGDIFASPIPASSVTPFLGAFQLAHRE